MEGDKFYDSLEGDFSGTSNVSLPRCDLELDLPVSELNNDESSSDSSENVTVIIKRPEYQYKKSKSKSATFIPTYQRFKHNPIHQKTNTEKERDLSSTAPFYDGDKDLCEIKSKCCLSNPSTAIYETCSKNHKKRRFRTTRRKSLSSTNLQGNCRTLSKSYLKMFHSRIGYPEGVVKPAPSDTTRSIFGDSNRSSISISSTNREEFEDAEDNLSYTTSFYFKEIEENDDIKADGDQNITISSNLSLNDIPQLNIGSVSGEVTSKSLKGKQSSKNSKIKPLPVRNLGKLSPDTTHLRERAELRKKQLEYGQKSSNRNRIRLTEIKILNDLKNEIENANFIKNLSENVQ